MNYNIWYDIFMTMTGILVWDKLEVLDQMFSFLFDQSAIKSCKDILICYHLVSV